MACRLLTTIFTALLISGTLVESRPEILLGRPLGSENNITLTCRISGSTSIIDNAIFRRDGVILNPNEPMPSYQFHITPGGEGNFTCEEDGGGGERSEVLQLAAEPKDREVDNKVIYVYRGDVIEIPCDYSPGNAADLYSVGWVRTRGLFTLSLTPASLPSEPHLSISPENYSLFVNITELEQNGHRYHCTVTVESFKCESCPSSPTFTGIGADITLRVPRRPQISITRNPDMSTNITEGDQVEYTCDVTAEREIESIYWKVGSSQFTDCSDDTYCVKSTGDNVRVLTVTTAGILTSAEAMTLDIECVVLQEFDDNNIIDPDSHNLTDMTSLTTSSGVSLLMIHPVPPDPSTSEIPTPTITNTIRFQENSSDKAFLEEEGFLFVIGAVVIIVLIVVGIPALACCIRYKYRDKCKKPSKRTSRPHEYEDVELAHQELPGELFQSMLSRQNGVPYDPNYVELPSWDGNMSDLNQDQVYNSSGASSVFPNFFPNLTSTTSLSSGPYDHTSHRYDERDAGSGSETYAHLHLDPQLWETPKRTRRTSDSSDHSHRSHHRHRSRSPVFNHDTHRHTSRSPVFNHDTHRHTSRSPVFNHDTPRHRSRSPCERCSPSPSHRSAFHVPEPEPVMPLYSEPSHLFSDTPPRPIGHEVLLTVVKCLMHRRDCQIPNCPCKAVQNQYRQLLSDSLRQLNEDSLMECAGCAGIHPSERREQMRLSLSTSNLNSNTHPHYHLTSRPQIRRVTPKPILKRQRSKSMDLTPIMEQRTPMTDKSDKFLQTADGGRDTPDGESPPAFLREISISADNIPALCLNDCPITPSPLRENRSIVGATLSVPLKEKRSQWMVPPTLRSLPENQLSADSTSSDESNTSSRDGSGNVSPHSDIETKKQSSVAPHPSVRMLLETSGSVNESGYDTNPSDNENSLPGSLQNSAEVKRKQYVSSHGVPSIAYESLQLPVEGVETHETLC